MALRTSAANRPMLDDAGFFHGVIAHIEVVKSTDKYKPNRFKWTIEGPGTIRRIGYAFTTSSELSTGNELPNDTRDPEEDEVAGEGQEGESESPSYNTLVQICLALELVTEEDLDEHHLEKTINELDLEAALGLTVRCHLAQRTMITTERGIQRKTAYITPVLDTLVLD